MSLIGKMPINIPNGVEIKIDRKTVLVSGPKGNLEVDINDGINVLVENQNIIVTRDNDAKETRSLHGLIRSLINNAVIGVSQGFKKELEIIGTGYNVNLNGSSLLINVGFSHPVFVGEIEGIQYETQGLNAFSVSGIDKYLVGEIAAKIRSVRPPEPYKGKGIRYKDEHVRRKAGKTVGK
jgi:large subunit ribosomal protein L6